MPPREQYIRHSPYLQGAYSWALQTGNMTALAANAPIFSLRYSPANGQGRLVLKRLAIPNQFAKTAFTAAQQIKWGFYIARNFTASDSGGTPVTLTKNQYQTGQPATGIVDMRIATTGALTAGTRTLDPHPFAAAITGLATTPSIGGFNDEMEWTHKPGNYPVILQPNEGIVIANLIAFGATGVIVSDLQVEVEELSDY